MISQANSNRGNGRENSACHVFTETVCLTLLDPTEVDQWKYYKGKGEGGFV